MVLNLRMEKLNFGFWQSDVFHKTSQSTKFQLSIYKNVILNTIL